MDRGEATRIAEKIAEQLLNSCQSTVGSRGGAEVMKCALIKAKGFQDVLDEGAGGRYGTDLQLLSRKMRDDMDEVLDWLPAAIMTHSYGRL